MMAEEPPYLQVGTEVSAKYKGAFCEAKIKAVKILVKCRVNYGKGNLATINNDWIKGSLKPGSKVEAKHSDGTYHPASIIRVTDASVYTVVFDDGDECTLRRSSLCLQGARHFKESQTLDQLPLTDPENFGNPVMLSGKRRRRHVSESSDDESEDSYQAKRISIAKDYPIGTVMFLENDRRRSSWLPVVIVPAKCCMEESSQSPNQICVRSFRDGRFYTAEPSELHEFAEDKEPLLSVLNGDLHHTHKQAIDKAMAYMSTQELPWDMDIPQKKHQPKKKQRQQEEVAETPSPSSSPKVEDVSDQDEEEREKFLTVLKQFHLDRGTPMTRPPVLSQKTLDLYRLYQLVQEYGGMEKVTQDMKWKHLYNKLGLSSQITSASYSLKMAYKKHLFPFEEHQRTNDDKDSDTATDNNNSNGMPSPTNKTQDQQSGDEDCRSMTSTKSDQEINQGNGPPDNHHDDSNTAQEITDMDTTDNVNESEPSEEKSSAPSTYTVGEKIKVWYGKGKFLKSYVAKIMDSTMESGLREYYVHYSGWNARYDEWIPEERVATRLAAGSNERTRPSTAKKKQPIKNRRGRPPNTFGPPEQQPHPQHGKAAKQQQKTTTTIQRESPVKPATVTSGEASKPTPTPSGRGPGRPKKKRSTPVTTPVTPETATAIPPTAALTPAPPSPPAVPAKTETTMNHATPPSPHNDKDTDTATTIKDESTDTADMDSDNANNTSNTSTNSTEQVTAHNDDDTTVAVEPEVPSGPAVEENVKKEIVEEKISSPSPPPPSPPKPVEPVVPVESPKQKSPSPPPQSPPCPEVTPPPAVATPIKEEVPEPPCGDVVATPQGSTKKKRGTPDGKKKAKASLQERRREQASDWIVDFSKMPELDSAGRIAILTEKIGAIQKRYAELKAEVAYLDRKKRRAKQREREAIRNNQSPVVECQ